MWCVAELDEPYIERMEDVLALYEKPYDAAEPGAPALPDSSVVSMNLYFLCYFLCSASCCSRPTAASRLIEFNWKFDRKAAREKFAYKKNSSRRSKT